MFDFSPCATVIARRWSVSVFVLTSLALAGYWLIEGQMPQMDHLLIGLRDGLGVFAPVQLPVVVPRLLDLIIGSLLLFVLIAKGMTVSERGWREFKTYEDAGGWFVVGALWGILGYVLVVGWSGVVGAVIGSLIASGVIACFSVPVCHKRRYSSTTRFGIQLVAVASLWCVGTFFHGALSGLVYAGAALIAAWVADRVVYIVYAVTRGISEFRLTPLRDRVIKYYTSCDELECKAETQGEVSA